jgi:hypothetical protein
VRQRQRDRPHPSKRGRRAISISMMI